VPFVATPLALPLLLAIARLRSCYLFAFYLLFAFLLLALCLS
jgi:hypothetical protein